MKIFLKILLIISLISVLTYLYLKGLLVVPDFERPSWFIFSVIILFFGFYLESVGWHAIVKSKIKDLSFKDAFISNGKFIFSKYIPGKLWIIAGRAGYLKEKYKDSFVDMASFSFYFQLIGIFSGLLVGLGVIYYIDIKWFWIVMLLVVAVIVIYSFFYKYTLSKTSKILSWIFRREIQLPDFSSGSFLKVMIIYLGVWMTWSVSFYLFLLSLHHTEMISLKAALIFPVSTVLGIIVVIAPGGLGFREGFLTFGLTAIGMHAKDAASIAILSRLWFLLGESLFFGIVMVIELLSSKKGISYKYKV